MVERLIVVHTIHNSQDDAAAPKPPGHVHRVLGLGQLPSPLYFLTRATKPLLFFPSSYFSVPSCPPSCLKARLGHPNDMLLFSVLRHACLLPPSLSSPSHDHETRIDSISSRPEPSSQRPWPVPPHSRLQIWRLSRRLLPRGLGSLGRRLYRPYCPNR